MSYRVIVCGGDATARAVRDAARGRADLDVIGEASSTHEAIGAAADCVVVTPRTTTDVDILAILKSGANVVTSTTPRPSASAPTRRPVGRPPAA